MSSSDRSGALRGLGLIELRSGRTVDYSSHWKYPKGSRWPDSVDGPLQHSIRVGKHEAGRLLPSRPEDGGRTWPHRRDVEVGDGSCLTNNSKDQLNREFSYPSILQTPDGALHLAFTYWRQAIKSVRVSEAWVKGTSA